MADVVNSQVVDSVTSSNLKNLGDAPAVALASVYQILAQSVGLSMQNAVASQQRLNEISNLATAAILKDFVEINPSEAVSVAKELAVGTDLSTILSQLGTALGALQQFTKTAQTTPPETGKTA